MPQHKWTNEDFQLLRDNSLKLSATQLGRMIGVSKNAVIGMCRRMNIPLTSPHSKKPRAYYGRRIVPKKLKLTSGKIQDQLPKPERDDLRKRLEAQREKISAAQDKKRGEHTKTIYRQTMSAAIKLPRGANLKTPKGKSVIRTNQMDTDTKLEPLSSDQPPLGRACQWPYGNEWPYKYCGRPAECSNGSRDDILIYCQYHASKAWVGTKPGWKTEK